MRATRTHTAHRASATRTTRSRYRRGLGAVGAATLLAGLGLTWGATSSYAAETELTGQTLSGAQAPFGWVDPARPILTFDVGVRTPSMVSINAPGYSTITAKSRGAQALGYCVEPNHTGEAATYTLLFPQDYVDGGRDRTYPVESHTPKNIGQLSWIAQNAYPAVDAATFAQAVGTSGSSPSDLYNGVQAAIWHFTSGYTLRGGSGTVQSVYSWLVSNAKNIPPTQPQLRVTPAPSTAVDATTTKVGPITIQAYHTVSSLTVAPSSTLPEGVTLVDENDTALGSSVRNGTKIFAKVPAGSASGTINLTIKGQGQAIVNGMFAVGRHQNGRAQTQMLVGKPLPSEISTTASLSWTSSGTTPFKPVGKQPDNKPIEPQAKPSIATIATGSDGSSKNIVTGGPGTISMVHDTVTYRGLIGGHKYHLSGVLMDKVAKKSTGITGGTAFTAEASGTGTAVVKFKVPSTWAGKTLVAFETLHQVNGSTMTTVAEHRDFDDADQTIGMGIAPLPQKPAGTTTGLTPSKRALPMTGVTSQTWSMAGLGLTLALAGGGLLMMTARPQPRRRYSTPGF